MEHLQCAVRSEANFFGQNVRNIFVVREATAKQRCCRYNWWRILNCFSPCLDFFMCVRTLITQSDRSVEDMKFNVMLEAVGFRYHSVMMCWFSRMSRRSSYGNRSSTSNSIVNRILSWYELSSSSIRIVSVRLLPDHPRIYSLE